MGSIFENWTRKSWPGAPPVPTQAYEYGCTIVGKLTGCMSLKLSVPKMAPIQTIAAAIRTSGPRTKQNLKEPCFYSFHHFAILGVLPLWGQHVGLNNSMPQNASKHQPSCSLGTGPTPAGIVPGPVGSSATMFHGLYRGPLVVDRCKISRGTSTPLQIHPYPRLRPTRK